MLRREFDRAFGVATQDTAAKAIAAVIGDTHRVLVVLGADDAGHGAEQFVVIGGLAGLDIGQHGGGIEGARTVRHLTATRDLGALRNRLFDLFVQILALIDRGHRAHIGTFLGRIAGLDAFEAGDEFLDEGIVDLVSNDEALAVDARLAVIIKARLRADLGGEIEIGVFEHHVGIVRAQLHHRLLDDLCGLFCHVTARPIRTGQRHAAHLVVRDDLVRGIVIDDEHGEDIVGKAAFLEDLLQHQPAADAERGVLQQHAIADHQAGDGVADDLIGREVPGLDAVDDADRRIGDDAARRVVRIALLVGQLAGPGLRGIVANPGAQFDFVAAVADQLADLCGHQLGQLFLVVAQGLADALDDFGALFEAARLPFRERLVAGIDLLEGFVLRHLGIGFDVLAGGGVDGCDSGHEWGSFLLELQD